MKLTFDEANHAYKIDGAKIPSYSRISRSMGIVDYSDTPECFLESARRFGQSGHYATRLWDNKTIDIETLSAPLIPCLDAYKQFLLDYDVEIIPAYIETPICSFRYRYGVTPDRIYLVKGELSIVELKFVETMKPGTSIQTAAQKLAAEEYYKIKIKARYGLQITLDGKYKLYPYKEKSDENVWLCFLGAFNWKDKNGKRT